MLAEAMIMEPAKEEAGRLHTLRRLQNVRRGGVNTMAKVSKL